MKLLMENWRQYLTEEESKDDFTVLCENHTRGLISERVLLEAWEKQVITEMKQLLDEGVMDILKIGYEKGKQLVGKAKEAWDAAVEKVGQFINQLCMQAWKLIQRIKQGLEPVIAVLQKVRSFINKICGSHPILCKATKILLMMIAIAGAMALFSSEAQAAVDLSGLPGESPDNVLSDTGVNALKGFLEMGAQDNSPEHQQLAADAFKWLEQAHNSDTLVDLAEAQEDGAKLVRSLYEQLKDVQADPDLGSEAVQGLAQIGEDVMLTTKTVTQELFSTATGNETVHIEWESLKHVK